MGTWSFSSFGNDGALDFIAELNRATNAEALLHTPFQVVLATDIPDLPDCQQALVSAEVIASLGGKMNPGGVPESFSQLVSTHLFAIRPTEREKAMAAVQRILDNSDMRSLSGNNPEWRTEVEGLLARLH